MIFGRRAINTTYSKIHCHDEYEISVSLQDGMTAMINDKEYTFNRGDIMFFPGGISHGPSRSCMPIKSVVFVCFDREFFLNKGMHGIVPIMTQLMNAKHFHIPAVGEHFITLLENIVEELDSPALFTDEKVVAMLSELIIDIARQVIPRPRNELKNDLRLVEVCDLINRHPEERYTLKWGAKKCGICQTSFMLRFKQLTGMTFVEYVNYAKIRTAIKLCAETDLSIAEIAYNSGFENLGNFHTFFKRYCNVTPLKYRQLIKEGGQYPHLVSNQKYLPNVQR